jgi:hypothetical protein
MIFFFESADRVVMVPEQLDGGMRADSDSYLIS